jgi:co-chaperonin GroES (HSP10)
MRTFDLFVVEIPRRINDTITTASGLELFIDNRFKEFENRVTEGKVMAVPFKYDTGVEVGDTLYFHHLVVINEGQPLTGMKDSYLVRFDPKVATSNQAIAYKSSKTGKVVPLHGWALLEFAEEKNKKKDSDIIEVVKLKEDVVLKGKVAFESKETEELGIAKGDVVGFPKNRDYRIVIDGKEYYRTRIEDLLYVEEEA